MPRMVSGSLPSTRRFSPLRAINSGSFSVSGSRPSSHSLRAILLQLTIFSIASVCASFGGNTTQRAILSERRKIGSGVCTMPAPTVPPATMTKAVSCISAPECPPSRMLPPRMAPRATAVPTNDRTSMESVSVCYGDAYLGKRQHAIGQTAFDDRVRHAVYHAARLVLCPHRGTTLFEFRRAEFAVRAHAGQHDREDAAADHLGGRAEGYVD